MKRFIQLITILILVLFSAIILFDDIIVKRLIINAAQKITNKKTELTDLNIYYLPNIKLELLGLKLPNPVDDNHLISSKKLNVEIDLNELLQKKLVINEITSTDTVFFDRSSPIKTLSKDNGRTESLSSRLKRFDFFKSLINQYTSQIQLANISTSISKKLSFNEEMREIDNVLTQTSAVFNQKKNNGLKLANEISYNLSQLNVQNTKSLLELDALRTKISETSKKTSVLGEEISSFNGIYLQSLAKIDDLNATINHRIDQAFSFNIQDGNEAISTKNIARSSNLLKSLFSRSDQNQTKSRTNGRNHLSF